MASSTGSGPRKPRRPASSRLPASRPRRVAGRGRPTRGPDDGDEQTIDPVHAEQPEPTPEPEPEPEPETDADTGAGTRTTAPGARPRLTAVLAAAIVLLVAIAGSEALYLWGGSDPVTSSGRPVVTSPLTARSVVDTAARSVVEIISASFEDYDEQVEEATSMMTSGFAEEYRKTKGQIKDDFVEAKTEVTAEVAEQGVVRADSEQVVALLFLTQTTTRDGGDLEVAQFKVEATMVRTDGGWLVSQLQTQ